MKNPIRLLKYASIVLALCMVTASGCSTTNVSGVPLDFIFIMDARSAGNGIAQDVNIQINAKGEGRYERYNTGGVIQQDGNDMVTYERSQVVEVGQFKLSEDDLRHLWKEISKNNFFSLTDDYRMQIGLSYAFILIEADGRRHQVFNIGMEVPEIRAIVETTAMMLPKGVKLEYGVGYILK